jgi:hypothetical protein
MQVCRHVFKLITRCAAAAGVLFAATAHADQHETAIRTLVDTSIRSWINVPAIVDAIKEQNAEHSSLTQTDIDRLDEQWRHETKAVDRPLINRLMSKPLSAYLDKCKRQGQGLYTEIIVMDNRGLNVAQSDVTSDYWQGDEAKWKKTFLVGSDALFIDEVEEDESTQQFQAQVSVPISDPVTNTVIGAITIGVNVDLLL